MHTVFASMCMYCLIKDYHTCMYKYMFIHPPIHPSIHTYIHTCIHTYIHAYIHATPYHDDASDKCYGDGNTGGGCLTHLPAPVQCCATAGGGIGDIRGRHVDVARCFDVRVVGKNLVDGLTHHESHHRKGACGYSITKKYGCVHNLKT